METTSEPAVARRQRLVGLDILRAAAVVLVLFGHAPLPLTDGSFGRGFFFVARQLGLVGVDLFFVLSGFLIGAMLLTELRKTGQIALRRFWVRRAWRLWPMYLLAILLGWQWYHWVRDFDEGKLVQPASFGEMWPYFAHWQNYYDLSVKHYGAGAVMQTWAVVVLIHFYILFGLLVALLGWIGRRKGWRAVRSLPWIVAITFVLCYWGRWHSAPIGTYVYKPWSNFFPTHLRLDEPMFGVLLAYWVVYHRARVDWLMPRAWWLLTAAGIATLIPVAIRAQEAPRFLILWAYTLSGVGCGAMILCAWWWEQHWRENGFPSHLTQPVVRKTARAMAWVGVWAYAISLSHQPLVQRLFLHLRDSTMSRLVRMWPHAKSLWESRYFLSVTMLGYLALAILVGAIVYWCIEWPFLLLREKMTRSAGTRLPIGERKVRFSTVGPASLGQWGHYGTPAADN